MKNKKNVKNKVIPNRGITLCPAPECLNTGSRNLQRLSLLNNMRGRSRIKYGMTPNLMGFTLIELLVVVLIIGILAAVAVPQYQKAVEKAKALQAVTLLKSITDAATVYEAEHGDFPSSLSQLDVSLPGDFKPISPSRIVGYSSVDTYSNGEWEIQLERYNSHRKIFIFRTDGPYKEAGFMYTYYTMIPATLNKKIHCFESFPNKQAPEDIGKYCNKLLKGQTIARGGEWHAFSYNN